MSPGEHEIVSGRRRRCCTRSSRGQVACPSSARAPAPRLLVTAHRGENDMKPTLTLAATTAIFLSDAHARADAVEEPKHTSSWYGWQTLSTDAAAAALVALSTAPDSLTPKTILGTAGVATYILGGPIVHTAHSQWGKAGVSLLLRVAA